MVGEKIYCENCKEPIVSEEKAKYIDCKKVCMACFHFIKRSKGNEGRSSKSAVLQTYISWLRGDTN